MLILTKPNCNTFILILLYINFFYYNLYYYFSCCICICALEASKTKFFCVQAHLLAIKLFPILISERKTLHFTVGTTTLIQDIISLLISLHLPLESESINIQ